MESLHIIHTNDLHSHFENFFPLKRQILKLQQLKKVSHETVLTFDIGDAMDRFHPLSEASNGKANIELMNQLHYDAVTIGNNEGIGNAHEQLVELYQNANFPVLLANIKDRKTNQLATFAKAYQIFVTAQKTRVAVIGFTAPFFATYQPNGWEPTLIQPTLKKVLAEIQGQYDVLIVLSHLGLRVDEWLATNFPQIDLILGAHTHHLLESGKLVNGVLLAAAGKYGQYLGEVQLTLDEQHRIIQKKAWTTKTSTLPTTLADEQAAKQLLTQGETLLKQKEIANLNADLNISLMGDSPLITTGLAAIKDAAKVDAAVLNTGLFLKSLKKGPVTALDLHQCLPHPMHLIKVSLKGTDLWRLLKEMQKNRNYLLRFPIKGMSFRGQVFGDIITSGMSLDPVTNIAYFKQEEVLPEKRYTFVTVDHYLFIPYFPSIEISGETTFLFPDFLRNTLGNYLKSIASEERK